MNKTAENKEPRLADNRAFAWMVFIWMYIVTVIPVVSSFATNFKVETVLGYTICVVIAIIQVSMLLVYFRIVFKKEVTNG